MLIADANVLLTAFAVADPAQPRVRAWLTERLTAAEPFGVSDLVLSAVVRISTNHRVYPTPATPGRALEFCDAVRDAPASVRITPGERHWGIFAGLVRGAHATANLVPDAYLAAIAIENGATLATRDRGFARFAGLPLLDPLAEQPGTGE